jgi:hypothetical protein
VGIQHRAYFFRNHGGMLPAQRTKCQLQRPQLSAFAAHPLAAPLLHGVW